jgi:hypothetical protein
MKTTRQTEKWTSVQADGEEGKQIVSLTKNEQTYGQTELGRGTDWMTKMRSDRQAERRACRQTGRIEEGKGRGRLTNR